MKTIKEIADLCGMSKTSVNRAIQELQIEKVLSGNKNLIADKDAERIVLLLRGFGLECSETETNQTKTETNQNISTQNNADDTETDKNSTKNKDHSENTNENFVNFLMDQIKEKDKQISNLQEDNKLLIQAQAYTLKKLELLTETIQIEQKNQAQEPETPHKKRWWNIFK